MRSQYQKDWWNMKGAGLLGEFMHLSIGECRNIDAGKHYET